MVSCTGMFCQILQGPRVAALLDGAAAREPKVVPQCIGMVCGLVETSRTLIAELFGERDAVDGAESMDFVVPCLGMVK